MMGARLGSAMCAVLLTALPALAQADMKPPQAPPAAKPGQDEDPRAKAVREAYEEQLRRERLEVTIKVRSATIDQVVEEFRRQTGWNIVLDRKNIPDDYRIDEFIVEKEPARRAFEAFAAKAELSMEDVSATLIMLSRPPRLTFNFRDADIKVVIDMIARVSGANIIIAPDVKGTITLSINNVPWNEVLNAVVKTLNYTTVKESFGIIRVIHPDELLRQMEVRVFPLKYLQPPSTYTAKVESGELIEGRPLQPATSIQELLERFVLSTTLQTVLSRSASGTVLGTLNFDPQTNVFIVRDTKVVLDRVDQIVKMLDVEPDQVVLDVKFISTTNRDLLQFGVNWALGDQQGITVASTFLNPAGGATLPDGSPAAGKVTKLPFGLGHESNNGIGGGSQFFMTEFDMTMTFRAFKNDRYSKLVQEPTLTVVDNREATIFVGDTISYPEVRTVSNQFGGLDFSLTEAANSPVKVGFQLFIVPKIVVDVNKVILTVIPQNTFLSGSSPNAAVAGFTRFSLVSNGQAQSIDLPRVSETTVVSKMVVDNGRTAVLGGLVVERASYEDNGIPILKDLPIFSYLFKQRTNEVNKDHLLIFITPRIVRAGAQVSEGFQELLRIREESERAEFERMKKDAEQKK